MTGLRVATYNLYLGADLALLFDVRRPRRARASRCTWSGRSSTATRFEERARAVAAILARERPDLVGLQEVSRWTPHRRPDGEEQVLVDFLPTLLAALERGRLRRTTRTRSTRTSAAALPVSTTEWIRLSGANVTLVRRDGRSRSSARPPGAYDDAATTWSTGIEGVTFPVVRGWGRVDVLVDGAAAAVREHPHRGVRRTGPRRAARRGARRARRTSTARSSWSATSTPGRTRSACPAAGRTRGRGATGTGFTCGQAAGPGQRGQHAARADRLRVGARRRGARLPGRRRPRGGPHRAARAVALGPRRRRGRPGSRLSDPALVMNATRGGPSGPAPRSISCAWWSSTHRHGEPGGPVGAVVGGDRGDMVTRVPGV